MSNLSSISKQWSKQTIIRSIKKNGGFWSYQGLPEDISDNALIEESLYHLHFEDMNMLMSCYGKRRVKRIWKERLLKDNRRNEILNFLLAVLIFDIKNPTEYIRKYGRQ